MSFNSTENAWNDMTVSINGINTKKVKQLKGTTSRESEHLYGAGDDPFDVNLGNKTHGGTASLYQSVINSMNDAARAAGFDDLTDIPWVIIADYKKTATAPKRRITYPNVVFESFDNGGSNNDKSFVHDMPFKSLKPIDVPL